jgi:hypothetical protein
LVSGYSTEALGVQDPMISSTQKQNKTAFIAKYFLLLKSAAR